MIPRVAKAFSLVAKAPPENDLGEGAEHANETLESLREGLSHLGGHGEHEHGGEHGGHEGHEGHEGHGGEHGAEHGGGEHGGHGDAHAGHGEGEHGHAAGGHEGGGEGHGAGGAHGGGEHGAGGHGGGEHGGKPAEGHGGEHGKPAGNHPDKATADAGHATEHANATGTNEAHAAAAQAHHAAAASRRAAGHSNLAAAHDHAAARHEAASKPSGGGGHGGDDSRDDHGRFAPKRAAFHAAAGAALKSFEGAWGSPYPVFDRLADEQGDFELARSEKAMPPTMGEIDGHLRQVVANPTDPPDLGTGSDFAEMVSDWAESADWELGDQSSDDPDNGLDGGEDPTPPPGMDDEDGLDFSFFDEPSRTELRAKADQPVSTRSEPGHSSHFDVPGLLRTNPPASPVAACPRCDQPMRDHHGAQLCDACGYKAHVVKDAVEWNAGGDGFDDHPWGEPDPFQDNGVVDGEDWVFARDSKAFASAGGASTRPAHYSDEPVTKVSGPATKVAQLPDAALVVVFNDKGDVLTVTRPEPPHEFAIPGGIVDPGESPAEAAVRELAEECGIQVTLDDSPALEMTSPTDGRCVLVFTASSFTGTPRAAEPNTEVAFLSPNELLAQATLYRASARQLMASGMLTKGATEGFGAALTTASPAAVVGKRFAQLVKDAPGQAVTYQGIPVVIDRPKGYTQRGTDPAGAPWERTYLCDYGYIPGTCGGDGEGLDVFLGPCPDTTTPVFVCQLRFDGSFDEYKLLLGFPFLEAAVEMYLAHVPIELFGWAILFDLGAVKALLGQDPRTVIETFKATHVEALMATVKKDAQPAGPGGQPNGDETAEPVGGGGADLVEIAYDRLGSVLDSIGAAGGVLTTDLKADVSSVVALLEAVAPGDDDEEDEDDSGAMPAGPGQGMPFEMRDQKRAEAFKAWHLGKKEIVGHLTKAKLSPEAFVTKVAKWLLKLSTTKNAALRKVRAEGIQKMLTYGPEAFGETQFSDPKATEAEIPMYTEAFVDVHTTEDKVPTEEPVKANWAYDGSYTPNENSQQAFDAGSPDFVSKVRKSIDAGRALLVKQGVIKADGPPATAADTEPVDKTKAAPDGTQPAVEPPPTANDGAPVDKGNHNVEKDGWTAAYVNELPDSSFLYVEPGGKKDAGGLTEPRTLRHFPYKDQGGKVDLPHLRNALARIPDSGISDDKKKELTSQAQNALEQGEGAEKSAVSKGMRGDDGWPDDLTDTTFLKGSTSVKDVSFGYDNLQASAAKLEKDMAGIQPPAAT